MMKYIKYIACAIAVIFFGVLVWKYFHKTETPTQSVSPDSTYIAPEQTHLRPTSIPFEPKTKPIVREPQGVPQEQIDHTYRIITKDSSGRKDTTSLVVLKNGQALVDNKDGQVQQFLEQDYLPPIIAFGLNLKVGLDAEVKSISPAVGVSFLELYGEIQLPVLMLDLQGIGVGIDCKVLKQVSLGLMVHESWQAERSSRLFLVWTF